MAVLDQSLGEKTSRDGSHVDPRIVTHYDHYNLALVRTLLTTEGIDTRAIVENAAAELTYQTLRERASASGWRGESQWLGEAAELFRASGLGVLDLSRIGEQGGDVRLSGSHFTHGWVEKYGRSKLPVCAVAAGYLTGALAATYSRVYRVVETSCVAQGKPECRFRVTRVPGELPFSEEPASYANAPISLPVPPSSSFDEAAVVAALLDVLPSVEVDGKIPGLGGTVTRLWADFYTQVSYRFERELPRTLGTKFINLPSLVLVEAGHTFAFHAFGGIMRSREWRERVVPLLRSREDWLYAAVAIINTFGWGTWRVHTLVPGQRATIRVYDSYEAAGYWQRFGRADVGKCYFARGTAAALMNLLYVGDIIESPELTPSYYNQLFRSPLSFRAVEARCRVMNDPYCEFIINPLSPGLTARLLFQGLD